MVPRSALRVDETCKLGKETNRQGEKEEMNILILTGLVVIIALLAFIAFMVYAIGDHISEKDK